MRLTLEEVLGDEGRTLYTLEWLRERAEAHLDPARFVGEIFLAEEAEAGVVGHTIVRIERDERGTFGLFSTTWVNPESRRAGLAERLLDAGETWFMEHRLRRFATDTSDTNTPLLALFGRRGYTVSFRSAERRMVRLERVLEPGYGDAAHEGDISTIEKLDTRDI
ncbi:MAG TPA: GNAT family N-acetyltransferase [Myxococcota bacterium]|nr:GNAT family N-acetyltransferase [Myxococcota bacterium]